MVNYREILRLRSLGYSQRQIASSVRSSRDTVSQVCRLATIHGLDLDYWKWQKEYCLGIQLLN